MGDNKIKESILFQLDMCWQLYLYHTEDLQETEALWAFKPSALQIRKQGDGWAIDWPEREDYDIGPSSIAWTMGHIIYWWSTALDNNFGNGQLKKEDIPWPGNLEKSKITIKALHHQWVSKLNQMTEEDYQSRQYAKWPFEDRNLADIALWLNVELMKNAAEIGYGRFLYATSKK